MSSWREQGLSVFIDLSDLGTFIALEQLRALPGLAGQMLQWLPLSVDLFDSPGRKPRSESDPELAAYKARRQKARDQYQSRELSRNCEYLGISLQAGGRNFDAGMAGLGLLFLDQQKREPLAYIASVFHAGFELQQDLDSLEVITGLLDHTDPALFEAFVAGPGPSQMAQLQDELLDAGIFKSPAFVLNGERFLGREHLPLIRWYLTGARGQAPI